MDSWGKTLALVIVGIFLLSLVTFSSATVKASPKTITVPTDYPTIQSAIGKASAGDTVFVKNGVYHESIYIDKSLSLVGENSQNTVIIGAPYRFTTSYVIEVRAPDVLISNFKLFDDGVGDPKIGVWIGDDSQLPSPSHCRIIGNNIEDNGRTGIDIQSGENDVISENNITGSGEFGIYSTTSNIDILANNITGNGEDGIIADLSNNVTIRENNISENGFTNSSSPDFRGGLDLRWNGPFFVYGNNITDNQGYGVQFAEGTNSSQVYQNNIINNSIGINLLNFSLGGDSTIGSGNRVYFNNLIDNSQQAVVERELSGNTNSLNGTDIVDWDNGKIGNYWSDYKGNGTYIIDPNNIDHHPLTQQIDITKVAPTPFLNLTGLSPLMTYIIISGALVILSIIASIFYLRKHRKISK